MTDFRSGAASILVATNVAARGLDFEDIGQVINYDLPDSQLLFTHRIGRTGRMGRSGEAVTFITVDDERKWREIERALGRKFARKPWRTVRKEMAIR
jgi:superfamily II DNA/RNA helicase